MLLICLIYCYFLGAELLLLLLLLLLLRYCSIIYHLSSLYIMNPDSRLFPYVGAILCIHRYVHAFTCRIPFSCSTIVVTTNPNPNPTYPSAVLNLSLKVSFGPYGSNMVCFAYERPTMLGIVSSSLRKPSVIEKWCPLEIAKVE